MNWIQIKIVPKRFEIFNLQSQMYIDEFFTKKGHGKLWGMRVMNDKRVLKQVRKYKQKVKIRLLKADVTQVELSQKIGKSPAQVSRAINGDLTPVSNKIRTKIDSFLENDKRG